MTLHAKVPGAPANSLSYDLAGEVLRSFGVLRFPATGHSMLPVIWPGDTLIVDRVLPDEILLGDVLVFRRADTLCAHRVIGNRSHLSGGHWITRGDALPEPDSPVDASEILGRVSFLIRAGRLHSLVPNSGIFDRLIPVLVRRSMLTGRTLAYLSRIRRRFREPQLQ